MLISRNAWFHTFYSEEPAAEPNHCQSTGMLTLWLVLYSSQIVSVKPEQIAQSLLRIIIQTQMRIAHLLGSG